jgi:hypothetical protein
MTSQSSTLSKRKGLSPPDLERQVRYLRSRFGMKDVAIAKALKVPFSRVARVQ